MNLVEMRKKLGKSQSEVSTVLGMGRSKFSRLELEPSGFTCLELSQLAKEYGYRFEGIFVKASGNQRLEVFII